MVACDHPDFCNDVDGKFLVELKFVLMIVQSFTYFFPSIVATLGYPRVITLLLTAPPYFAAFLFSIANSWHSGRVLERGWHIIVACSIGIVGQVTAMSSSVLGARYFAFFLCAMGAFSAFQVILSWVSSTIPRPKAKRAVAIAMATAFANCANIPSAYLYPTSDAPMYRMGGGTLTGTLALCIGASLFLKFWLKRLNKKAEERDVEDTNSGAVFRYIT